MGIMTGGGLSQPCQGPEPSSRWGSAPPDPPNKSLVDDDHQYIGGLGELTLVRLVRPPGTGKLISISICSCEQARRSCVCA